MKPFSTSAPKPKRKFASIRNEIIDAPSPNFDERKRPIRFVILHYTGMPSDEAALKLLQDPHPLRADYESNLATVSSEQKLREGANLKIAPPSPNMSRVSAHYVVFGDGRIFQLVKDDKRAWQAGSGFYLGETDGNSASIGIEICNGGYDFGLPEFPQIQIDQVMRLVTQLKQDYGLDKRHIIGHSDWAPMRKLDPGEKFPWDEFAKRGISMAIKPLATDGDLTTLAVQMGETNDEIKRAQIGLKKIGYGVNVSSIYDEQTMKVLIAFQRHYRQSNVSGILDVETLGKIEELAGIL